MANRFQPIYWIDSHKFKTLNDARKWAKNYLKKHSRSIVDIEYERDWGFIVPVGSAQVVEGVVLWNNRYYINADGTITKTKN